MNVLYCGDRNIEKGLIISILSLIKNNDEILNIYVLTIESKKLNINGVTDRCIRVLDEMIKEKNEKNKISKIDITDMFEKEIPVVNMSTRFTPCCMLRLFADEIDSLPDKILYLDNDVICRENCYDFYNQDITNFEFAGTLDYYGKWFFKRNFLKFDYINSGVLLLNLKKIRETKLFKNARRMCTTKKMFMPDQSSINKLAINKKILPRKYNEQRKLKGDTVFQHFTTSFRLFPYFHKVTIKPWDISNLHKYLKIFEYDDILKQYLSIQNDIKENI